MLLSENVRGMSKTPEQVDEEYLVNIANSIARLERDLDNLQDELDPNGSSGCTNEWSV